jgi:hypothetical protein
MIFLVYGSGARLSEKGEIDGRKREFKKGPDPIGGLPP